MAGFGTYGPVIRDEPSVLKIVGGLSPCVLALGVEQELFIQIMTKQKTIAISSDNKNLLAKTIITKTSHISLKLEIA